MLHLALDHHAKWASPIAILGACSSSRPNHLAEYCSLHCTNTIAGRLVAAGNDLSKVMPELESVGRAHAKYNVTENVFEVGLRRNVQTKLDIKPLDSKP
jgi:hypothetical protein